MERNALYHGGGPSTVATTKTETSGVCTWIFAGRAHFDRGDSGKRMARMAPEGHFPASLGHVGSLATQKRNRWRPGSFCYRYSTLISARHGTGLWLAWAFVRIDQARRHASRIRHSNGLRLKQRSVFPTVPAHVAEVFNGDRARRPPMQIQAGRASIERRHVVLPKKPSPRNAVQGAG